MDLRRTSVIGVASSLVVILIFMILFNVRPEEILAIGPASLSIAVTLVIFRLLSQGVRFHLIARQLDGTSDVKPLSSILVRIGSEFISLITPSYIGGEAIRIAWLTRRGAKTGQAIWAGYLEVLYDVIFASAAALIAVIYALTLGAYLISALVFVTTLAVLSFYILLTVLSIKGRIRLPKFIFKLLKRFSGKRITDAVESRVEEVTKSYGEAAGQFLGSSSIISLVLISLLTFVKVILAGAIFMVILHGFGVDGGIFLSILAVYSAISVSSLPITPGGSGLSEIAISLFISGVYAKIVWSTIVTWRVVSYHIPLAISGAALILSTHREMMKPKKNSKEDTQPSVGKVDSPIDDSLGDVKSS